VSSLSLSKKRLESRVFESLVKSTVAMHVAIDKYFQLKYGKGFIDKLLDEPVEAYNALKDYFNSEEAADFFIYLVLKVLHRLDVNEALEYLKKGDSESFKRLLRTYLII